MNAYVGLRLGWGYGRRWIGQMLQFSFSPVSSGVEGRIGNYSFAVKLHQHPEIRGGPITLLEILMWRKSILKVLLEQIW